MVAVILPALIFPISPVLGILLFQGADLKLFLFQRILLILETVYFPVAKIFEVQSCHLILRKSVMEYLMSVDDSVKLKSLPV